MNIRNLPRKALSGEDYSRLVKILRLLGSDQIGERASAAARAHELLAGFGLDWEDVLAVEALSGSDRDLFDQASQASTFLGDWDKRFLIGIAGRIIARQALSPRQRAQLERIAVTAMVAMEIRMMIVTNSRRAPPAWELARNLKAKSCGENKWVALAPCHDDHNESFSITADQDGLAVVHCFVCPWERTVAELRRRGWWPERQAAFTHHESFRGSRAAKSANNSASPSAGQTSGNLHACEIWRQAVPLTDATSAEPARRYLDGRGVLPETFDDVVPVLRFNRLWHKDTRETVPCLIVAKHAPSGYVGAIQRIYIDPETFGKYSRGEAKKSLGSCPGSVARIFPVIDPDDGKVILCEGAESALAAHRIFGIPSWAMCGGFPKSLPLPARIKHVTIIADADANHGSEQKAHALARHLRAGGRTVRVLLPREVKDANDVLLLRGAS